MRVALVHDWLTGMRGGERVLERLLELLPDAEIFTLLHVPGSVSETIEAHSIHTSFLDRVPLAHQGYRRLLPLFPRAIEGFDLTGFDLVVSSSHCVAKGVPVPDGVPHLCYCHTPMRYVWDQYDAYFGPGRASLPVRAAMAAAAPRLRAWDVRTAAGVTRFVANSRHVRERIRRHYGREASVVHPPVELSRFRPRAEKEDYHLVLGAAAPYKRIDLALDAFRAMDRPLVVAGPGTDAAGLRARAGSRTRLLGPVSEAEATELLAGARGLVLPGEEDFGITVAEALACGTPVVALGRGGVLDMVREASRDPERGNGVLFDAPTVDAVRGAVARLEGLRLDAGRIAASVAHLAPARFLEEMRSELDEVVGAPPAAAAPPWRSAR